MEKLKEIKWVYIVSWGYLRIPLTNSVNTCQCEKDLRNGIQEQCVGDGSIEKTKTNKQISIVWLALEFAWKVDFIIRMNL